MHVAGPPGFLNFTDYYGFIDLFLIRNREHLFYMALEKNQ